jgi:hypothetical protein
VDERLKSNLPAFVGAFAGKKTPRFSEEEAGRVKGWYWN